MILRPATKESIEELKLWFATKSTADIFSQLAISPTLSLLVHVYSFHIGLHFFHCCHLLFGNQLSFYNTHLIGSLSSSGFPSLCFWHKIGKSLKWQRSMVDI